MQKSKCTHIRIRDNNDYNLNVEALIKSIEKEFNIDFRSLPQWQDLVKRLHSSQTDYKRRIQNSNLQKANIIDKLYIEHTRSSPFQLSAELARTAKRWQQMKNYLKGAKIASVCTAAEISEEESEEVAIEEVDTLHPNSEIIPSEAEIPHRSTGDIGSQLEPITTPLVQSIAPTSLPVMVCTNTHKLISPLDSQISQLSYHIPKSQILEIHTDEAGIKEWQPSTSAVICKPTPINVTHNTLDEQCLLFSLVNCTREYLHIRFKYITDPGPFVKAKILPKIPKRLYPGIPVVFKLIFILKGEEAFTSGLYFRIGRTVYSNAPTEPFFIPIVSAFIESRVVKITDPVIIPSVYPWHIKIDSQSEFPSGTVKITVEDPYAYHLHIYKRHTDLSIESDVFMSMRASTLDTESLEDRESFIQSETIFALETNAQSKTSERTSPLMKLKSSEQKPKNKAIIDTKAVDTDAEAIAVAEDIVSIIVDDIVGLALEAFVFDCTYMYLQPHSKRTLNVSFTKAEHIGYHQSYYDCEFIDPETETVVIKKSIRVFAEVLPNPIQVQPIILDMSNSELSHGYYENQFVVTNTHKVFAVTAYIKLTSKMKKLFYVIPMKSVVPPRASVTFEVKFCSRQDLKSSPVDDLVHFTFKIVVVGYKTVYHHVPPIFYEIIVPCASEFKKIYNEKYFKDTEEEATGNI